MSILSKSFKCNFTQVPNEIINDKRVSLKAKGLYLYMVSKPDNWDFSFRGMSSQLKEGIDSIVSTIEELIKFGYMQKIKNRSVNGLQQCNDYILHEKPIFPTGSENPNRKTRIGKPESENSHTSNTIQSNKEKSNTSSSEEKKSSFSSFRESFKTKYKNGFTLASCPPWRSDTMFYLDDDGLIVNGLTNQLLNKDDSLKIWNYLYNKYKG